LANPALRGGESERFCTGSRTCYSSGLRASFAGADTRRPGGWLTPRAESRAAARAASGNRKPLSVRPHPHPDRGVLWV